MTKQQKLVLLVSILASFIAFLDGSVINVALPAISGELGGGLLLQQWVVDAYLLTLGSLILIAGSLSDLFGRKKILLAGLLGFGIASILCAAAPSANLLIGARALQGLAGALLVPSSLALIISAFTGTAQSKAIGTWTAWTGIAFVVGPLVGGLLVDLSSWRFIFAINILPILLALYLLRPLVEPTKERKHPRIDIWGALLCALGLGGPVYALIEQPHYGWASPQVYAPLIGGIIALVLFLWHEGRTVQPMLPLKLFKVRNFWAGNLATTTIYAGLSVATFLITIFVQQVGHYSALAAGLALLPITLIMFVLSSRFGALAGKYGPRLFMTFGPLICALGLLTMLQTNENVWYWTQILPGVLLFGLGLSITVAPLTSAVLGSINANDAGIGSAINNAVSRIAGLVAIAAIGSLIGANLDIHGFRRSLIAAAALLALGGIASLLGIVNPPLHKKSHSRPTLLGKPATK